MINKSQIFKLSQDVLSQEIDGESILLDMKSENYFGLNEVGSHVLEMLQTGSNLESLVEQLRDIYDIDKQQLEIDIIELLQQLLKAGLISEA